MRGNSHACLVQRMDVQQGGTIRELRSCLEQKLSVPTFHDLKLFYGVQEMHEIHDDAPMEIEVQAVTVKSFRKALEKLRQVEMLYTKNRLNDVDKEEAEAAISFLNEIGELSSAESEECVLCVFCVCCFWCVFWYVFG